MNCDRGDLTVSIFLSDSFITRVYEWECGLRMWAIYMATSILVTEIGDVLCGDILDVDDRFQRLVTNFIHQKYKESFTIIINLSPT